MSAHVEVYLRALAELRAAKETALAAWNAMTREERVSAMEGERDAILALAEAEDARGRRLQAGWLRDDAARVQGRIDEATRLPCPACGQSRPQPTKPEETQR